MVQIPGTDENCGNRRSGSHNFGRSVGIRSILIPRGNQNLGVAAVQPAASNCPPDSCIEWFESRAQMKIVGTAEAVPTILVGVSGFEPEASWTRTKRDTKLRHTPLAKLL